MARNDAPLSSPDTREVERRRRSDRRRHVFGDGDERPRQRTTGREVDRRQVIRRETDPKVVPGLPAGLVRPLATDEASAQSPVLTLRDIRTLTQEVARELDPALDVIGAVSTEGGADYVEVLITMRNCQQEPCRITIGIDRRAPLEALRAEVSRVIRDHLRRQRQQRPQ